MHPPRLVNSPRRLSRAPAGVTVAALACALLAGCKNQTATPEPFIGEYRSGDYSQAYRDAEAKAQSSEGLAKDRASLMAGMSAYAERKPETAERWLGPLQNNPNPEIAGTAEWTLGLIALDRGNDARASVLLPAAADKLKGDDAAKANLAAGEAFTKLGRLAQARERFQLAANLATSDATRAEATRRMTGSNTFTRPTIARNNDGSGNAPLANPIAPNGGASAGGAGQTKAAPPPNVAPPPSGSGYVIQLAAVSDASKAASLAQSATPAASKAGQPKPVVTTTTDRKTGQTLFGVQIGPYATRSAAEAALKRTGLSGSVMAITR